MLFCLGLILPVSSAAQPAVDAPEYLPPATAEKFREFQQQPTHRAFALGAGGAWGQSLGHADRASARREALAFCREHAPECVVIAVDDRITQAEDPFPAAPVDAGTGDPAFMGWPDRIARPTANRMALAGLVLLIAGTMLAERYPVMLAARRYSLPGKTTMRFRMNYTQVAVMFAYFLCVIPLMSHLAPEPPHGVVEWLRFFGPIVPAPLSVLYLNARGKLKQEVESDD